MKLCQCVHMYVCMYICMSIRSMFSNMHWKVTDRSIVEKIDPHPEIIKLSIYISYNLKSFLWLPFPPLLTHSLFHNQSSLLCVHVNVIFFLHKIWEELRQFFFFWALQEQKMTFFILVWLDKCLTRYVCTQKTFHIIWDELERKIPLKPI